MDDDDIQHEMKRHDTLYFADGNVVLLAPKPDKSSLLFRVHKSILSSHSSVFLDMFEVCNSSDEASEGEVNKSYDGAPLIHMLDDANHLESILKIIYFQNTLPSTSRDPQYHALVTPILDLSIKYNIDRIQDQIFGKIESEWPQTLKDWDKLERDLKFMANDPDVARTDDCFPEPAGAIKFARRFDIPIILPAAFYHLSRLSILDDWEKIQANPSVPLLSQTKCVARWQLLSAQDYHSLLLGKAELAEFLRKSSESAGELRHARRNVDCSLGVELWKDICGRALQSPDPLALLQDSFNIKWKDEQYCNTCAKALKTKIREVRSQIWEGLGDFFYLNDEAEE